MNDTEREMWVNNDESLYNWKRSTRLSMREFIRSHREEIDQHIISVVGYDPCKRDNSTATQKQQRDKAWIASIGM